jgi:hypothetical protein
VALRFCKGSFFKWDSVFSLKQPLIYVSVFVKYFRKIAPKASGRFTIRPFRFYRADEYGFVFEPFSHEGRYCFALICGILRCTDVWLRLIPELIKQGYDILRSKKLLAAYCKKFRDVLYPQNHHSGRKPDLRCALHQCLLRAPKLVFLGLFKAGVKLAHRRCRTSDGLDLRQENQTRRP